MENNDLISIVIPVYNTKSSIKKCIESIIRQKYSNLEIIIVDDGSTDGSGELCDIFMEKDDRIIVIHKKNEGVSSARNAGIIAAKGKYIGFVDSDDYIEEDMFLSLYNNLIEFNLDISMCNYNIIYNKTSKKNRSENIKQIKIIDNKEYFFQLLPSKKYFQGFLCNKLFKSKALKENMLNEKIFICEDLLLVCCIASNCRKFGYDERQLYNYSYRKGSAVNTITDKTLTVIDAYEQILSIVDKCAQNQKDKYILNEFYWCNNIIHKYIFNDSKNKEYYKKKNKELYKIIINSRNLKVKDKLVTFLKYRLWFINCILKKMKYIGLSI